MTGEWRLCCSWLCSTHLPVNTSSRRKELFFSSFLSFEELHTLARWWYYRLWLEEKAPLWQHWLSSLPLLLLCLTLGRISCGGSCNTEKRDTLLENKAFQKWSPPWAFWSIYKVGGGGKQGTKVFELLQLNHFQKHHLFASDIPFFMPNLKFFGVCTIPRVIATPLCLQFWPQG